MKRAFKHQDGLENNRSPLKLPSLVLETTRFSFRVIGLSNLCK